MNKFLLVGLMSFILSSTYEIQIQMDDYQGIRQGSTTVSYNGENAGKVKRISERDDGGYIVTLKIYDTFDISKDMLFKVENRKLVVDLDRMEQRKLRKEEERLAKIKAEEDAIIATEKAKAEEGARIAAEKAKAEEGARIAAEKAKAEEDDARIATEKATNDKAYRLKVAADNSPFIGDIEKIKDFQNANGLEADGFWGPGSQKVFDSLKAKEEKERELKEAKTLNDAKMATDKAKDARIAAQKAKAQEDARVASEKTRLEKAKADEEPSRSELDLLREQYDNPPKLKRKLKIKAKKYKGEDSVTVKFFVNKKGKTEEVMLNNGSGNDNFDSDVMSAIKKSKWNPAIKDGKKVGVWHQLEVKF